MIQRKFSHTINRIFENEGQIKEFLEANPLYEIAGYPNSSFQNSRSYSHISVIFNVYEDVEVPDTKPMFG